MADSIASRLAAGPFGLGCAPLGNLYRAISDDAADQLLDEAWEAGTRWFDTAPHYGLGLSERRLGRFLATKPRNSFVVSTKVGRRLVPNDETSHRRDDEGFDVPAAYTRVWDFTADGVSRTLEASLERLQLDHIDVVLLHDPSDHLDQAIDEAGASLIQMREQGVVGAIGAGTRDVDALARIVRRLPVDLVMAAGRYTLLNQDADDILLPLCLAEGVSVLNAGVFNSGVLAFAEPEESATYEYGAAAPGLIDRARKLAALSRAYGSSLPAAALAFSTSHPAIAAITVGASTSAELLEDVALASSPPSNEFWRAVGDAGLIPWERLTPILETTNAR